MSQSGYTAWSVTAGEVPTTAFWNVLGFNDASFNTGNGFNDNILLSRHFSNNAVTKSALELPHYNALYFSDPTGWVFGASEVRIPYTASSSRGNGITATTGSGANMIIARDGLYHCLLTSTCIDVNATGFITWLWIQLGGTGSFLTYRTSDRQVLASPSGVEDHWLVYLTAGTVVYSEAYNGGGNTRFGTDKNGGTYSEMELVMHHSLSIAEIR